jgi:hypothetical protein
MRIFGLKRDEGTGERRKFHSGELHNLYSSPDIIWQIQSSRIRWTGHVALMGEGRKLYKFLAENPNERDRLENRGLGGRMGFE